MSVVTKVVLLAFPYMLYSGRNKCSEIEDLTSPYSNCSHSTKHSWCKIESVLVSMELGK